MRSHPCLPRAATLVAVLLTADPASATAVSGAMEVKAVVPAACDVGGSPTGALAAGRLDFGHLASNEATANSVVAATMLVRCASASEAPSISFDNGANASGAQRNLKGPSGALVPYVLLQGSDTSSAPWDNQSYPLTLASDGKGDLVVYGYIPALPLNTPDGSYTDTVTVRLDY